jgi:hypothetical protein
MAIFSNPKLASRVPSFHVPGLRIPGVRIPAVRVPNLDGFRPGLAAATVALSQASQRIIRVTGYAVSPSWWWQGITSVAGIATLLALSVVSLIGALVVTWPHR